MASFQRKLRTSYRFPCSRTLVAFAFVMITSRSFVNSEDDDSLAYYDTADTDRTSSTPPDVTYYPLPSGTPPTLPKDLEYEDNTLSDLDPVSQTSQLPASSSADVSTVSYVTTSIEETSQYITSSSTSESAHDEPLSHKPTALPTVTFLTTTTPSPEESTPETTPGSSTSVDLLDKAESSNPPTEVSKATPTPPTSEEATTDTLTTITITTDVSSKAMLSSTLLLSSASPTAEVPNQRFCNRTRSSTYFTRCGLCFETQRCFDGDIQAQDSVERCRLPRKRQGCKVQCLHISQESACCQGYWGDNCDECPGGSVNPCNNHGDCLTSNGTCLCQPGFAGTACEVCEDETKYGINCSQDCSCVHGVCNNGVLGDGSCTCYSGYKGDMCDQDMPQCEGLFCHANEVENWRCADVNGTAACICAVGYEYTADVHSCIAKNPCEGPVSPCGKNSVCDFTTPGKFKCRCNNGYSGDGILCLPIDPCQTNRGGCEDTTMCSYTGPNQRVCLCNFGYENYVPGTGCSLTDVCTSRSCDPNAICETTEPQKFRCTCKEGYSGNGTVCYGNILERLKDINSNNPRFRQDLLYAITLISRFYAEPLTKHGPFTVFVPNDKAFRDVVSENKGFGKFLDDEDRAMQIMRQHILIGQFRLEDLTDFDSFYTLQGNKAQLTVRVQRDIFRYKLQGGTDRAKILARNFIASNGMIHIVNNLLTLEPEISGDKTKTAMDLIKLEGTYNRFQTLIMAVNLADVFTQPNITVFAPENGAWDALPAGTLDYLMKDYEGQEKLKVILKNHVFPGVLGVTHLINTPYIKSLANIEVKVSVSKQGQVLLDGKVGVSQVNIPCSTGIYHHIEGLIVPSYLDPILANTYSETLIKGIKGPCVDCYGSKPACIYPTDQPTDQSTPCRYYTSSRGRLRSYPGCAWICNREVKVPQCNPGFYGSLCMACPGGFRTPCNGRGVCSDGIGGIGVCYCDGDFMGAACDQCRPENVFGPHCNDTCTCLYGQCDDGPKGTGQCKKGSCQQGYQGEDCNQKLVPCHGKELICHAHAKCFLDKDNVASCQCETGYEGDGDDCKEIDPCDSDDNGGCHQQATCTKVGPGAKLCTCNNGWSGDGFYCSPRTACSNHSDCDVNAQCSISEPGQYHCVCKVGYKGDGKSCSLVNMCVENNGGCHPKAICTPIKVGERSCTCPENLGGDGFSCTGTISDEVLTHPNLTRLASMMQKIDPSNNMLDNVDDKLTLFAPSDEAMEEFMAWFTTWNRTSYWQDEENIIWFLNFHTVYNEYSHADLISLDGILRSFPTLYDGFSLHIVKVNNNLRIFVNHSSFATVSQPGVLTLNGYIHIIDKVLEPFLPDDQVPTLNETLSSKPQYQLFYQAMQITGVLDQIKDLDEYTVFVPTNDAIKHLNRTVNAEFIRYYIVPKLVFTASILDSDAVATFLGPQHQLLLAVTQNSMTVNGVQITRADVLLDGGVMHEIGGVLHPVLSRCDYNSTEMSFGDCGDCTNLSLACPAGYSSLNPPRTLKYECTFLRFPDAGWRTMGCQQICVTNITKPECCGGYFGPLCKECPGGAEDPCSGHGKCYAGMAGNGTCSCDEGFSGPACAQCEDPNMALPTCNVTYNSCGFRNGNCSLHAVCNDTSSGVSCRCPVGYVGDGYTCRSQCDIIANGGCHPSANCAVNTSRLAVQCTCQEGFHGNGTWCEENIDPCVQENGGCDFTRATCMFVVPKVTDMIQGSAICKCHQGYAGDGKVCSTDILDAISRITELSYFYMWLQANDMLNNTNATQLMSDSKARSTIFLPVSTEWQSLDLSKLVVEGYVFRLPSYQGTKDDGGQGENDNSTDSHITGHLVSLSGQLINITQNDKKEFFANGVKIVRGNIESFNGVVHLTEAPIVRADNVQVGASKDGQRSTSIVVIVCVVVAVVVVVVALVGAVIYIKKHHEGVFKIFKRSESNSESNISFARLSANEEEDDAFKASDNARYDNPIFDDPDVL